MRMAAALVGEGRRIDLAGLEEQTGRLCARALDLPPGMGRVLRDELMALRADAEALIAALQARGPA